MLTQRLLAVNLAVDLFMVHGLTLLMPGSQFIWYDLLESLPANRVVAFVDAIHHRNWSIL
jgi:hypothetical protein